jgi:hypothetical protein
VQKILAKPVTVNPSDNPVRDVKNAFNCSAHSLKYMWRLWMQMSHLSVKSKLDSFFKPALLPSKTNTTSESSIDEQIYRPGVLHPLRGDQIKFPKIPSNTHQFSSLLSPPLYECNCKHLMMV